MPLGQAAPVQKMEWKAAPMAPVSLSQKGRAARWGSTPPHHLHRPSHHHRSVRRLPRGPLHLPRLLHRALRLQMPEDAVLARMRDCRSHAVVQKMKS